MIPFKEYLIKESNDMDSEYFDAIARQDWSTAQKIVNKAAGIEKTGHSINRGDAHSPSDPSSGSPGYDITDNGIYPDDVYSSKGFGYYSTGSPAMDSEAYSLIKKMRGRPNQQVRIYRSVEKDGPSKIIPGDWVTIVKDYAKEHGEANINGKYKILSALVTAKDIYTSGDSWLEWGYHPQETRIWPKYIYKDKNGDIVPPSKRFETPTDSLS